MAELELIHIEMFAEDGDPGWYAGRMPDGRRVHAAHMVCSAGTRHWTGSVEDPDRCDCDQTEGTCRFCQIRHDGGLVFTKVTGCYRSANSAVRALKFWAANPDAPPPPAPFNCRWTAMKAMLCEVGQDALPLPLDMAVYVDGLDTGPVPETCRDDHLKLKMFCVAEDMAMMSCPVCGHEPEFAILATSADQATSARYGLPDKASRTWVVEHSETSKLGLVSIPADRRAGLFTHLQYEPDCNHDDCHCDQDASVQWSLEECIAVNIDLAELYG